MHGVTIVMVNLVMGPLTLHILQCASPIRHTSKYTMLSEWAACDDHNFYLHSKTDHVHLNILYTQNVRTYMLQ